MKKFFSGFAVLAGLVTSGHASLTTQMIASGFSLPILMQPSPTDSSVLFVVQQRGRVRTLQNGVVTGDFLNLVGTVSNSGGERGLLGLAFHPNYASNGFLYVNYTRLSDGATRIVRYQRDALNPLLVDPASAFPLLTIPQPFNNHNGGTIRFGADGFLYIGMGDGGDGYDPGNRAQNLNELLGKMLRIDVNSDDFPGDPDRNYRIPSSNPFAVSGGAPEIWSCGIRNPWKFSFDRTDWLGTGGMLMGDVGQDLWEEVNYEPAGQGGRNYGWRNWEGFASTGLGGANAIPPRNPIHVYSHSVGQSITGGYVYRGTRNPGLFGRYAFADFVQGRLFSGLVQRDGNGEGTGLGSVIEHTSEIGIPDGTNISSIDVDSAGELYYLTFGGQLHKVLETGVYWPTDVAPRIFSSYQGSLRSIASVDGFTLNMFPQEAQDLLEENQSQVVFGFTTDLTNTNLILTVNAKANQTGGKLSLELRNWTNNKFVSINTYSLGTTMATLGPITVPAAAYRRSSDKRIEVLIKTYRMGVPTIQPYTVNIDRIRIQ